MSDYLAHSLSRLFVPALIVLLKLCLVFGGSSVGELRVLACKETEQVATLWQVSIDGIDFKLKRSVRWSIIRVHSRHSCCVMHGLPLPWLHDNAQRSELNYPSDPRFFSSPQLSSLSAHCQTLPFYTPWSNTVYYTPQTTTSKILQFLFCSIQDVHYMMGAGGALLLCVCM